MAYFKIVSFKSYDNKNLVLETAALESVEDFCRFVVGPWLLSRNTRRYRRHLPDTVLTSCECCGVLFEAELPIGSYCLCDRCEPLVSDATRGVHRSDEMGALARGYASDMDWD